MHSDKVKKKKKQHSVKADDVDYNHSEDRDFDCDEF